MLRSGAIAISFGLLTSATAYAQTADGFYKGKTIDFYIGFTPGGGNDVYARLIARHLGKHIPGNPNVVPKNMVGAGSLRLANWMYTVAPRDGTAIGTVSRYAAFEPLFGTPGAQFDSTRFNWIGSANREVSVFTTWHTSKIVTMQDVLTKPFVAGGASGGSGDNIVYLMNSILNAKIKVVMGYPGSNELNIAMERGEIDARITWSWSTIKSTKPEWLRDKSINIPMQLSLTKHKELPHIPLLGEAATTPEQKQIFYLALVGNVLGRVVFAPPELPPDRAVMLRDAFNKVLLDQALLAEAEKMKLEINGVDGAEVESLVRDAYKTPPEIGRRIGELLNGPK